MDLISRLREFLVSEVIERRPYSATKAFEVVYDEINRLEELQQKIIDYESWIDVNTKLPPYGADILFTCKNGITHAGYYSMPIGNNIPVYKDFKKEKIRHNVFRWRVF